MDKILVLFGYEVCDAVSVPPGYFFKKGKDGWLMCSSDSPSWRVISDIDAKAFFDEDFTFKIKMIVIRRPTRLLTIFDL